MGSEEEDDAIIVSARTPSPCFVRACAPVRSPRSRTRVEAQ
jgi:hypothetical protein